MQMHCHSPAQARPARGAGPVRSIGSAWAAPAQTAPVTAGAAATVCNAGRSTAGLGSVSSRDKAVACAGSQHPHSLRRSVVACVSAPPRPITQGNSPQAELGASALNAILPTPQQQHPPPPSGVNSTAALEVEPLPYMLSDAPKQGSNSPQQRAVGNSPEAELGATALNEILPTPQQQQQLQQQQQHHQHGNSQADNILSKFSSSNSSSNSNTSSSSSSSAHDSSSSSSSSSSSGSPASGNSSEAELGKSALDKLVPTPQEQHPPEPSGVNPVPDLPSPQPQPQRKSSSEQAKDADVGNSSEAELGASALNDIVPTPQEQAQQPVSTPSSPSTTDAAGAPNSSNQTPSASAVDVADASSNSEVDPAASTSAGASSDSSTTGGQQRRPANGKRTPWAPSRGPRVAPEIPLGFNVGELVQGTVVQSGAKGTRVQLTEHPEYIGWCPQDQLPVDLSQLPPLRGDAVVEGDSLPSPPGPMIMPMQHTRNFRVVNIPFDIKPNERGPLLSAIEADVELSWKRAQQLVAVAEKGQQTFTVTITGYSRIGLLTRFLGLRSFIPYNQLVAAPELGINDWSYQTQVQQDNPSLHFVGKQLRVAISSINEDPRMVRLSPSKAARWAMPPLEVPTLVWGTVNKVMQWGAFVRLDNYGIDGLLHVSKISRAHVAQPADVLSVGDRLCGMVVEVDDEAKKIALNTRLLELEDGDMFDRSRWQAIFNAAPDAVLEQRRRLEAYALQQQQGGGQLPPQQAQQMQPQPRSSTNSSRAPALSSYEGHTDPRRRDESGDDEEDPSERRQYGGGGDNRRYDGNGDGQQRYGGGGGGDSRRDSGNGDGQLRYGGRGNANSRSYGGGSQYGAGGDGARRYNGGAEGDRYNRDRSDSGRQYNGRG